MDLGGHVVLGPSTQKQSLHIEHRMATSERSIRDPGVVTFEQTEPASPRWSTVAVADDFDRWIASHPPDLAGLGVEGHDDSSPVDGEAHWRHDPPT